MQLQSVHFAHLSPGSQQTSPSSLNSSLRPEGIRNPHSGLYALSSSNSLSAFQFIQPKDSFAKQAERSYYVRSPTLLHSRQFDTDASLLIKPRDAQEKRTNIAFSTLQFSTHPRLANVDQSAASLGPFTSNNLQFQAQPSTTSPLKSSYSPKPYNPIPSRTSRIVRMVVTQTPRIGTNVEIPKLYVEPPQNSIVAEQESEPRAITAEKPTVIGRFTTRESSFVTNRIQTTDSPEFGKYRPISRNSSRSSVKRPAIESTTNVLLKQPKVYFSTAPQEQNDTQSSIRKAKSQKHVFEKLDIGKSEEATNKIREAASRDTLLEEQNARLMSELKECKQKLEVSERERSFLANQLAVLTEQLQVANSVSKTASPSAEQYQTASNQSSDAAKADKRLGDQSTTLAVTNAGDPMDACQIDVPADQTSSTDAAGGSAEWHREHLGSDDNLLRVRTAEQTRDIHISECYTQP